MWGCELQGMLGWLPSRLLVLLNGRGQCKLADAEKGTEAWLEPGTPARHHNSVPLLLSGLCWFRSVLFSLQAFRLLAETAGDSSPPYLSSSAASVGW